MTDLPVSTSSQQTSAFLAVLQTSQIQPMTVAKAEFLLAMWNLIPADGPVQRDLPKRLEVIGKLLPGMARDGGQDVLL